MIPAIKRQKAGNYETTSIESNILVPDKSNPLKPIEIITDFDINVNVSIVNREVYRIAGVKRDYLTLNSAIKKLSYILTENEFKREGKPTNYKNSEICQEFITRQTEILDEIKYKLKKHKEFLKLKKEYNRSVDKLTHAIENHNIAKNNLIHSQ